MYGTTIMYVTCTLVLCAGLLPTQVLSYVSTEWYRCPNEIARNDHLRTYNETCYEFVTTKEYWGVANSKCNQNGGHLIEIRDNGTQLFVMKSLQALSWRWNGLWIGAHDSVSEGSWKWVTGDAVTWDYWDSGQPEWCFFPCIEDCANLRLDDGYRWHDKPCDSFAYHYTYICQYNMGPRTTTTTTTTPAPTTPKPTTPKPTTPIPTTTPTEGGSVTSATHSAAFSTDALIGLVIGLLAAVCIVLVLVGFLLLRRCKLRKQNRSNIPIGVHNVGSDSSTEQVRVTESRTTDNIYVNAAGLPTSRPSGTYVYDNRRSNPYDVPDTLNVNDVDSGKEFSKSSCLDDLPDL